MYPTCDQFICQQTKKRWIYQTLGRCICTQNNKTCLLLMKNNRKNVHIMGVVDIEESEERRTSKHRGIVQQTRSIGLL